jgi:hypothetical protein
MSRIFLNGSSDGLGLMAAKLPVEQATPSSYMRATPHIVLLAFAMARRLHSAPCNAMPPAGCTRRWVVPAPMMISTRHIVPSYGLRRATTLPVKSLENISTTSKPKSL